MRKGVIGIDTNAALRLAAARGCDLTVLSELLPAAEAGLVEALCADADRPMKLKQRHQRPVVVPLRSIAIHGAYLGI